MYFLLALDLLHTFKAEKNIFGVNSLRFCPIFCDTWHIYSPNSPANSPASGLPTPILHTICMDCVFYQMNVFMNVFILKFCFVFFCFFFLQEPRRFGGFHPKSSYTQLNPNGKSSDIQVVKLVTGQLIRNQLIIFKLNLYYFKNECYYQCCYALVHHQLLIYDHTGPAWKLYQPWLVGWFEVLYFKRQNTLENPDLHALRQPGHIYHWSWHWFFHVL